MAETNAARFYRTTIRVQGARVKRGTFGYHLKFEVAGIELPSAPDAQFTADMLTSHLQEALLNFTPPAPLRPKSEGAG